MIDNGSLTLLWQILENPAMKVEDFTTVHGLTQRSLHARLELLNDHLTRLGLSKISLKSSSFAYDHQLEEGILAGDFLQDEAILFEEEMRPKVIYLYIFIRQTAVSNFHLQWLLNVSKNTAFSDVKSLRAACLDHHIQVSYSRKEGYHLKGTEMDKRSFAISCINDLLDYSLGRHIVDYLLNSWEEKVVVGDLLAQLKTYLLSQGCLIPQARLENMLYFYSLLKLRSHRGLDFTLQQQKALEGHKLGAIAQELCQLFGLSGTEEEDYMVAQLLTRVESPLVDPYPLDLDVLANQILDEIEQTLAVYFDNRIELFYSLKQHLLPAYYRILFDIATPNPLLDLVVRDYSFLFEVVARALRPLERELKKAIPPSEIAFLTMLIGGRLRRKSKAKQALHARIICPNGVSASALLRSQLEQLFPGFVWSVDSYFNQQDFTGVDMIFSTIFLKADIPVYVTKPLLSVHEKNYLLEVVNRDFHLPAQKLPTSQDIVKIVARYADIWEPEALEQALTNYIRRYTKLERNGNPMLKDLLTADFIHFSSEDLSWEEAIALSVKPLEEAGKVKPHYKDAIVERVRELGPYIHIGKGVAIPHARPEDGVERIGMSFLKLDKPVYLDGKAEHEVDTFIALAAIDNSTHLTALAELTQILSNTEKLEQMKAAKDAADIIALVE